MQLLITVFQQTFKFTMVTNVLIKFGWAAMKIVGETAL